jgi:hypothetical protein
MGKQRLSLLQKASIVVLLVVMVGCGKEKFTSSPQLTFRKAENYEVSRGGLIRMYLEVTDAEGDLTDTLFIETTTTRCAQSNRKLSYQIPPFNTSLNTKAELEISFVNGQFVPGFVALPGPACGRPDTTTFKFWIKDQAQNVSDTVQTDKPIIILN